MRVSTWVLARVNTNGTRVSLIYIRKTDSRQPSLHTPKRETRTQLWTHKGNIEGVVKNQQSWQVSDRRSKGAKWNELFIICKLLLWCKVYKNKEKGQAASLQRSSFSPPPPSFFPNTSGIASFSRIALKLARVANFDVLFLVKDSIYAFTIVWAFVGRPNSFTLPAPSPTKKRPFV